MNINQRFGGVAAVQQRRLGFLGAGSMAEAMIKGVVQAGWIKPGAICVANRSNRTRLAELAQAWGVVPCADVRELVSRSTVLVLAAKPKDIPAALESISPYVQPGQLVISVAAGIPTALIERALPAGVAVVRAMPNTSCAVLESATALSAGSGAGEAAMDLAADLFACIGRVVRVPEAMMNAVTGLSGSGPAYFYYAVEAMLEAADRLGMEPPAARELVVQTLLGAAQMLRQSPLSPAELRRQVTSPGGTTEAGLQVLAQRGWAEALADAVVRAAERAGELAPPLPAAGQREAGIQAEGA